MAGRAPIRVRSARRTRPGAGEHTDNILLELGYDWESIALLKDDGVIL